MSFLKAIEEKGGRVYEVGGTLRDLLLGLPHKDKDLLVTQLPIQELLSLLAQHGNVQTVGQSFGVIKFRPHGAHSEFDIALPRIERSTGVGHRDFEVEYDPNLPVEKDLGRRYFTVNAMARDLKMGELIDPFGGQEDLRKKILRQVFPGPSKRSLKNASGGSVLGATRFCHRSDHSPIYEDPCGLNQHCLPNGSSRKSKAFPGLQTFGGILFDAGDGLAQARLSGHGSHDRCPPAEKEGG